MPAYRGLALDFESLDESHVPAYVRFIRELYGDLHARNLRLYVNVPASAEDEYLKQIAPNTDGIVLMNYDQHETESEPGPIAAQDWFIANLVRVLKSVPKEKLICAIGNFGYDWTLSIPDPKDRTHPKPKLIDAEEVDYVSEAWKRAADADADLNLDYDTLNPHFEYIDEDSNQRHVVWFLDAVTALNRVARRPRTGTADVRTVAPGRGRQLHLEHLGPAQQPGCAARAEHAPAGPRHRHRGRRRDYSRHRPAQERQAHRRNRHRRARSAQEAHHR